jgi:hypothetical protein
MDDFIKSLRLRRGDSGSIEQDEFIDVINFIGEFDVDLLRRPPFELKQVIRQR